MGKYYARKECNGYVIRQERFREQLQQGREHPHDVMAYGRSLEELKRMADVAHFDDVDYSDVEGNHDG